MTTAVGEYLDPAWHEKERIKKLSWSWMDTTFIMMRARMVAYCILTVAALVFGLAAAIEEYYPGRITKP